MPFSEEVPRSPNGEFAAGDTVETRGNRGFGDVAMADDRLYDGALGYRE